MVNFKGQTSWLYSLNTNNMSYSIVFDIWCRIFPGNIGIISWNAPCCWYFCSWHLWHFRFGQIVRSKGMVHRTPTSLWNWAFVLSTRSLDVSWAVMEITHMAWCSNLLWLVMAWKPTKKPKLLPWKRKNLYNRYKSLVLDSFWGLYLFIEFGHLHKSLVTRYC